MKKVIVIGCPGSGKSTFSKALHKKTGIPLYHLDMIFWRADKTTIEKSDFVGELSKILKKDTWIIDGNYSSTMEKRIKMCDTVFFLDYPLEVCLDGIKKRKGQARSDIPWIENDIDKEFIQFIKSYPSQGREQVLKLLDKYSDKEIYVFSTRASAQEFLDKI